jgi:hypothetical protein
MTWAIVNAMIGPKAIGLPQFLGLTVFVFLSAWWYNIIVVSNWGIAKMPFVKVFSLRRKLRLFIHLWVTWTL